MPQDVGEDVAEVSRRLRRVVRSAPGQEPPGAVPYRAGPVPDAPGEWSAAAAPWEPPGEEPAVPAASRPARLPGPGPFDPGRRGVRALAAVAAVVVLVAALLAWRARPRPEPVPAAVGIPPAGTEAEATAAGGPAAGAAAESAGGPPAGDLVVAVTGKVHRPGLVRLPPGARVADAVEAAGGLRAGADVQFLNLARKVSDGELIAVGVTPPPGVALPGGAAPAAGTAAGPPGKVNLNTATLAELDALPGVGPVLAQRILDHRARDGAYRAVSDLREVDGIGEARFEQLRDLVTV